MYQEKITVIVPIYKVEQYLDRCIESIVNQSYQNLEIILVDDGSPDRCPEMCEQWAMRDNRIRVIHKENQGLGMARNTGIDHATGEFICYIDSDDYVDVDTIYHAYSAMINNHADLVVFGYQDMFPDGRSVTFPMNLQKTVFSGSEVVDELLPWMIQTNRRNENPCPFAFTAWSGMIRKSILDVHQIRFQSERQIISEDTLYLLELYSKLRTVALVPKPLYYYCVNPASLTKTYQKERQKKNDVFLIKSLEVVKDQGYSKEVSIRVMMLYQSFSLEAMKHVIRMKKSYRETRTLLMDFLSDLELNSSITRDTLFRSSIPMALFLICLKLRLVFLCWLFLQLREKDNRD